VLQKIAFSLVRLMSILCHLGLGLHYKAVYFYTMPQLLPFYFVNQLTFAFLVLITMIYVFSKYILPMFTELFLTRMYITKL
jgi:F-type H+-transporting ATPase subunit 8